MLRGIPRILYFRFWGKFSKYLTTCLLGIVFSTPCFAIELGIVSYIPLSQSEVDWVDSQFSLRVQGTLAPNNPETKWVNYVDIYGFYAPDNYLGMKEYAAGQGFAYEEMLLHAKVDWTYYPSSTGPNKYTAWQGLDQFGVFEGANGVLQTSDDVTYSDLTTAAYKGSVTLGDTVYFGYEEPFADINFTFLNVGSGVSAAWQYWNGSTWSLLSVTDGTSNFTGNGLVTFIPRGLDYQASQFLSK